VSGLVREFARANNLFQRTLLALRARPAMLARKPFMLWVARGNVRSKFYESVKPEYEAHFVPKPTS
jgi:hypothetical protein